MGPAAYSGDGGPATAAELAIDLGVGVDASGDVLIADTSNGRVREVASGMLTLTILPAPTIMITGPSSGTFVAGQSLTVQWTAANVVPGHTTMVSLGYDPDTTPFDANQQWIERGVVTAANGTASYGWDTAGLAAGTYYLDGRLFDSTTGMTASSNLGTPITILTPTAATLASSASGPLVYGQSVTVTATVGTPAGYEGTPTGSVQFTLGGSDFGPPVQLSGGTASTTIKRAVPAAYTVDAYYSGQGNFAASSTAVGPQSIISTVAGDGIWGFAGDGGPATAADLASPMGVAVDSAGDIFIVDTGKFDVREVNHLTGIITTVAGNGTRGYSGDGGPATAAEFGTPWGLAIDSAGDLFIADLTDDCIRAVNHLTGVITTVAGNGTQAYRGDGGPATAAELNGPYSVAVDSAGDVFIADFGNYRVREVNASTGIITTVAGGSGNADAGPATAVSLECPMSVAVDSSGDLFVLDQWGVQEMSVAAGILNTVAGGTYYSFGGDGGPATAAEFSNITGIAVDSAGNLFIVDAGNNRVREVNLSTGIINTVAGNGTAAYSGEGGSASAAALDGPGYVAVDAAGDLFIAVGGIFGGDSVCEVASSALTLTVDPAPLTVMGLTVADKPYDGTTAATISTAGASLSGVLPGDSVSLNLAGTTATFTTANAGHGISVTVTGLGLNGPQAGDYAIVPPSLTADIDPAPLTIAAYDNSKAYGTADPAFYDHYSGFVCGQGPSSLSGTLSLTTNEPTIGNAPAGVYQITPSGVTSSNYAITFQSGTLTVQAVPLTATGLTAADKPYDGTTATTLDTSGASLVGVLPGDSVSLNAADAAATFASADVGDGIAVTVAGLGLSGPQANDYTLTQPTGLTANIAPAPLTITADDQSMLYGTTVPDLTASYSGFVNGETLGSLTTLPTITTTATAASPLGSYPITVGGAADPDYAITYVGGTLSVVPATPTANADGYRTGPNSTLTIAAGQGVLANDSGPNGLALSRGPGERPGRRNSLAELRRLLQLYARRGLPRH